MAVESSGHGARSRSAAGTDFDLGSLNKGLLVLPLVRLSVFPLIIAAEFDAKRPPLHTDSTQPAPL